MNLKLSLVYISAATSPGNAKPRYLSIEQNKVVPESERFTTSPHICFTSIYNSSVYPNNDITNVPDEEQKI